jgi:hypothetical protein
VDASGRVEVAVREDAEAEEGDASPGTATPRPRRRAVVVRAGCPALLQPGRAAATLDPSGGGTLTVTAPGAGGPAALTALEAGLAGDRGREWVQDVVPDRTVLVP